MTCSVCKTDDHDDKLYRNGTVLCGRVWAEMMAGAQQAFQALLEGRVTTFPVRVPRKMSPRILRHLAFMQGHSMSVYGAPTERPPGQHSYRIEEGGHIAPICGTEHHTDYRARRLEDGTVVTECVQCLTATSTPPLVYPGGKRHPFDSTITLRVKVVAPTKD